MNTTTKDTPATGPAGSTLAKRVAALPAGADVYLSRRDMAAVAGVSTRTLDQWISTPDLGLGVLLLTLPGGKRVVLASRFRSWVEKNSARHEKARREKRAARS